MSTANAVTTSTTLAPASWSCSPSRIRGSPITTGSMMRGPPPSPAPSISAPPPPGGLVVLAKPDSWFTYYYWLDDRRAPDFARTVDIHRKPGYDPAELLLDPALRFPPLKVGLTLLRKQLGFRPLLEVIPLEASLVKGSHGRIPDSPADGPLLITQQGELVDGPSIDAAEACTLILRHLCADGEVAQRQTL